MIIAGFCFAQRNKFYGLSNYIQKKENLMHQFHWLLYNNIVAADCVKHPQKKLCGLEVVTSRVFTTDGIWLQASNSRMICKFLSFNGTKIQTKLNPV
jgi:hypothetical protein